MDRRELDAVRFESPLSSISGDSGDEPESDATEDEGDVAYELDAIKYATWMKSPMDRGDGRIKNVWRWHYGVMWRDYLRSISDSGDQPSENFDPEENPDDDLVVAFWRAIVNSPNAPPQLRLEPGQREPSDPGKALSYPYIFDCPHGQMRVWLKETDGKRLLSTYLQRRRWEKEHPDEPVPKRLSDRYVYQKRLREKARAEAAGEEGRRFIKGGLIALKPRHKRKIRESSSEDDEPERSGSASRSVGTAVTSKKEEWEDGPSRGGSSDLVKDKKAKKDEAGSRGGSADLLRVQGAKDGERSRSGSSDARKEEKRKRKAEEELEQVKKAKKAETASEETLRLVSSGQDGNAVAGSSSKRASLVLDPPVSALPMAALVEPTVIPAARLSSPTGSEPSLDSIFNSDHGNASQPCKKRKHRIHSSPVDEIVSAETKKARTKESARLVISKPPTPLFFHSRSPSPVSAVPPAEPTSTPSFGEPEPGIFDAVTARSSVKPRPAPPASKAPPAVPRTGSVSAPDARVSPVKAPIVRPDPTGPCSSKPPAVRPTPAPAQARPPAAQAGLPAGIPPVRQTAHGLPAGQSYAVRPAAVRPANGPSVRPIPTDPSATANVIRPALPPSLYDRTVANSHSSSAPAPVSQAVPAVASSSYVPRRPSQSHPPPQLHPQYLGQPWIQQPPALPPPATSITPIVSPHLPTAAELYKPAFDPRLRRPPGGQVSPSSAVTLSSPGQAFPNIFDRRFMMMLPFRSKFCALELSLTHNPKAGDISGAKLLNSLLFRDGATREDSARPLCSFEQTEACCLQGQIALGAKLKYVAGLNVFDSSAGVGGQQLWDDLGDRRGPPRVLASFSELVTESHISAHHALIIARADTIESQGDDNGVVGPTPSKLVFAIYDMPLDSRPPPMLPNPIRPFVLLSHATDTPPSSPKPVSITDSYGLDDNSPIPLKDRYVLIYPGRDGPLDTLYAAITSFCEGHGLRAAGDGRSAEVALLNNGKMSRVVRSTSIRQNLARRARFVSFGPNMDLYPSQWRATEVWKRGGLVTFSPTFILRSPERFAAIMNIVRTADTWGAYVVPEVLRWCDELWKQPARCPEPDKALDALVNSLPFDEQLARLSDSDATTTGGLVVSCCPPVIHDNAGCEKWITWLRKSSSCSAYPELVETCREVSSTGFSTSGDDLGTHDMALIDVETALLDDLARMRSRPHLLPYRRYILVGEVSLDRKARDRYEAEIEFVPADDFIAVISGAV